MKFKNAILSLVLGVVTVTSTLPANASDEMAPADYQFAGTLYFLSPGLMQTAVEILSDEQSLPTKVNIQRVLSSPAYADRIKRSMKAQECPERKSGLDYLMDKAVTSNSPMDLDAYMKAFKVSMDVADWIAQAISQ